MDWRKHQNAARFAPGGASSGVRRYLFVINSIGPGGAERVLANVLSRAPDKCECHLAILDQETDFRTLPDHVHLHRLGGDRSLFGDVIRLWKLVQALRPSILVAFLIRANVVAVLVAKLTSTRVVISERMNTAAHLLTKHRGKPLARGLVRLLVMSTYPFADRVIAVSKGVASDLVDGFGVRRRSVIALPNPIDLDAIAMQAQLRSPLNLPAEFIVAVGRLEFEKGYDDLLRAYALLSSPPPLIIIGVGSELESYERLCEALGIRHRVTFAGYLDNPFAVVAHARLFISASLCEGFPNAIAEAMALGVPVISTDCPSGPAELLALGEQPPLNRAGGDYCGLLVEPHNIQQLADAISTLLASPELCAQLRHKAQERIQDFAIDKMSARYWSLLQTA